MLTTKTLLNEILEEIFCKKRIPNFVNFSNQKSDLVLSFLDSFFEGWML